jgi:protocatechuate 3,4-dioxygenase beta subunit
MLISTLSDVTPKVLEEYSRIEDPRTREIVQAFVRHLHAFLMEVRLTEKEFQQAMALVNAVGKHTTASHNEAVLIAGSLGASAVVCLMNNSAPDVEGTGTSANMLGPFWRDDSPVTENGGSLLRSDTPGIPMFFQGSVRDRSGEPVADAMVDIWHSSTVGLYENQDPSQAEMNLRGRFRTDAQGKFWFRSIKPAGYPIPIDGPAGALLGAGKRHNMRPAHVHALIHKPGFKTITSQVYTDDDPYLETDCQFGVTTALLGHYELHESGTPPAPDVTGPWWTLSFDFTLEPGEARMPQAPITSKKQVGLAQAAE